MKNEEQFNRLIQEYLNAPYSVELANDFFSDLHWVDDRIFSKKCNVRFKQSRALFYCRKYDRKKHEKSLLNSVFRVFLKKSINWADFCECLTKTKIKFR